MLDLAISSSDDDRDEPTRIFAGDGQGSLRIVPMWEETLQAEGYAYTRALDAVDFDGDGLLDLMLTNQDEPKELLRADGQGGFTRVWYSVGTADDPSRAAALGDFDGDGDPDLAVGCQRSFEDGPRYVRVFENHRSGSGGLVNDPPTVRVDIDGVAATWPLTGATVLDVSVPVVVTLADPEGDDVQRLQVQYSRTGAAPWHDATLRDGSAVGPFDADRYGVAHRLQWDASADGVLGRHVAVRVVATGFGAQTYGIAPQRSWVASVSPTFGVASGDCSDLDDDGDGVTSCDDCDDTDPSAGAPAEEICDDGIDGDCDGAADADEAICWSEGGCSCTTSGAAPSPG